MEELKRKSKRFEQSRGPDTALYIPFIRLSHYEIQDNMGYT